MSKADDLGKKMGEPKGFSFQPRESINVKPLSIAAEPAPKAIPAVKPAKKAKASTPTVKKVESSENLATIYAKVPKDLKKWTDHYRIDEGKELSETITEALELLKKQVQGK